MNFHSTSIPCACVLAILLFSMNVAAKDDLSAKEARKLIAAMPGFNLKTGSIHVNAVHSVDAKTAEASADLVTAFRFEKDDHGQWNVAEFRVGQDQWQEVRSITSALHIVSDGSACAAGEAPISLSNKRARCLLAQLLDVTLPSDAVRIKSISAMSLPFSSHSSALVEALITAEFHFSREAKGKWRVAGVRTGNRTWVDPQVIFNAVNTDRVASARAELEMLAKALEAFRTKRGFYVESKSGRVLVDFLSPRYLARVIRVDPWRRPYVYEGTRNSFTLRSLGPDGKENTSDDIVLSGPQS
jgi:Type II secretion system (T2SS), protein G